MIYVSPRTKFERWMPSPRKCAIALLLVTALLAEDYLIKLHDQKATAQPPPDRYTASASTTALTIQAPASNGRQIVFGTESTAGVSIYCAAEQTATLKWNGTAATATAGTEKKLPGTQLASGMTIWTASNVGSGTTGPTYVVPAGATYNISLYWLRLSQNGTANNVTVATTGACTITFYYSAN